MNGFAFRIRIVRLNASRVFSLLALSAMGVGIAASAQVVFTPGNLVVSRSVYTGNPAIAAGITQLPPGCTAGNCATAVAGGEYPFVFNNDSIDGSFGVTSPLFLDEVGAYGGVIKTLEVPNSTMAGIGSASDQLVTSFSSKSEGALHLSLDGKYLTFIDYLAPVDAVDASNANTPGVIDPTNPVPGAFYRTIATVNSAGQFQFTETNAYSGNNGRAAIYVNTNGDDFFYTAGNAGNGANPEPQGVVEGAGEQIFQAEHVSEDKQNPGQPNPVASFNVTELGDTADKSAKDDNFRGTTLYNGILYLTKGSGSNGVNTVYFVDTTGRACPNGVGLPVPGALLPTASLYSSYSTNSAKYGLTAKNPGLAASNMCILKGFPVAIAKNATDSYDYPFGLWFANATTLYVADEGAGDNTYSSATKMYTAAAASTTAGVQKWVFNAAAGKWELAYTLQSGLKLGVPYTVTGYPAGNNSATGLPWAPATDGLRQIVGAVDGSSLHGYYAVIWATTSTVSGNGDQGADPNKLFVIIDELTATTLPAGESFTDIDDAKYGEVLRGVSFTPGTPIASF
jgi:hypothetical protein